MIQRGCESVGIDLGTTYSSLAYLDDRMTPRIVQDSEGQTIIPSVVYFDDAGVVVGETALQQAKLHADRVVQFIKVHMGDRWQKNIQGHVYTPEGLSAIILRHLVRQAEPQIGPIRKAVITVPAYFTEKRRLATQQAGEIAGLEVVGTLNEPMAATLAYGLHAKDEDQMVVVYDLGGGTFDCTVVRISPREIVERATCGNRQLGGRDWDQRLIDHAVEEFRKVHGCDPREDIQAMQDLQVDCERAKRQLSQMTKTEIRVMACGREHRVEVTRGEFEAMTGSLLRMTKLTTEMALEDADLDWKRISKILLVGGSTHMPAVRAMLQEISGIAPETSVNPVTAVALGAALYANLLEGGRLPRLMRQSQGHALEDSSSADEDFVISDASGEGPKARQDVAPMDEGVPPQLLSATTPLPPVHFVTAHGVGLKVRSHGRWKNAVLIPKNSLVPARAERRFVTAASVSGRASIKVEITQGDADDVELAEILGIGRIEGFSAAEPPGQPVDIVMEFNAEGRLQAGAVYVNTGHRMEMSVEVRDGLRQEQVEEERVHVKYMPFLNAVNPHAERTPTAEKPASDDSDFEIRDGGQGDNAAER